MRHLVIAGAGHAGMQLADSLRSEGFTAPVTLVNDESGLPYQRPPLSKDGLADGGTATRLPLKAENFFTDNQITLLSGNSINRIDRSRRSVQLGSGETVEYSDLVLATGARNRKLTVPGSDLEGVHYLRTADDASTLHAALSTARTAVVVGAGFIGLEFAAAARARGLAVTVIEYAQRPMARAISEETSRYFTEAHSAAGIRFVFGESVAAFESEEARVTAVSGHSGNRYPADIVAVGIGVQPNSELAEEAGLSCPNGVEVDAYLRTADEHIWAIGDCAYFPCTHTLTPTRRESVQNAVDQARSLARTLTGNPTEYRGFPWFWSNQGAQKLRIAGVSREDSSAIVHGDTASGRFSVLVFNDNILTSVESVNSPGTHLVARRLLSTGPGPSTTELAATGYDLASFARGRSGA